MQILSSRLVQLPANGALPIPWYHRAPLGMRTGSQVYAGLQRPARRPLGDLLLTLIDPEQWPHLRAIVAQRQDEAGILADAFGAVPPLNIVFAECATVDSGSRHEARTFLERPEGSDWDVDLEVQRLQDVLKLQGFEDVTEYKTIFSPLPLEWQGRGIIRDGWMDRLTWQGYIQDTYGDSSQLGLDLGAAVISADTTRRLLRFVFPRPNARSVSVVHADRPGAMGVIARSVAEQELNFLSVINRRGLEVHKMAEFVAIVEPSPGIDPLEIDDRLNEARSRVPSAWTASWQFRPPDDPEKLVYPRRPDEVVARPPLHLRDGINVERRKIPRTAVAIFVSRRFFSDADAPPSHRMAVDRLHSGIARGGGVVLEATPERHGGCREILATPSTTPRSWVTAESKTQHLVGAC